MKSLKKITIIIVIMIIIIIIFILTILITHWFTFNILFGV